MDGYIGYKVSKKDPNDHKIDYTKVEVLNKGPFPSNFDIYIDKSHIVTHLPFKKKVLNQNSVNSCVCNAFAGAYACALQRQGHDPSFEPSRLFLYYLARLVDAKEDEEIVTKQGKSAWFKSLATNSPTKDMPKDGGCYTRDVLRAISALGCCAEAKEQPVEAIIAKKARQWNVAIL